MQSTELKIAYKYSFTTSSFTRPPTIDNYPTLIFPYDFTSLTSQKNQPDRINIHYKASEGDDLTNLDYAYHIPREEVDEILDLLAIEGEEIPDWLPVKREYVMASIDNKSASFTATLDYIIQHIHFHFSGNQSDRILGYVPIETVLENNLIPYSRADKEPYFIYEKMRGIINGIIHNNYPDVMKQNYVHLKAVELLLHVTNDLMQGNKKDIDFPGLNTDELVALYQLPVMLEKNAAEKLTIPQIAKKLGLNSTKLKRGFKQLYGVSIHQFKIKLRMDKCYTLVSTTSLPLNEIAVLMGFASIHQFSNAFKKHFGKAPSTVRAKYPVI